MMLIITTSILFLFSSAADGAVRVTKANGYCKEYPHPKATFNTKFLEKDGQLFVDQAMNVTEEFHSFGKLTIIAERCPSRESLNYCEHLRNVTIPHFALLMENPANPWKKTFTYTPALRKPVKPGLYRLNEKKIDSEWTVISSKGYWRNKAIMMEEGSNNVVFCIYLEGEIR